MTPGANELLSVADVGAGLRYFVPPIEDRAYGRADGPVSPLGGLVYRPALYSRNAVSWCSVRAWLADARQADMLRLKLCKGRVDSAVIAGAGGEIADLVRRLYGGLTGWTATSIACGHSRRPDCFGKRLGQAVAERLSLAFVELFEDRFVGGVSHPKEFAKLPPLAWATRPAGPVLIIDDLATSGWHMEEGLGRIRALGIPTFGAVWIAGTVK